MAKRSVSDFAAMKARREPIVFLTAYDAPTAALEQAAGVDMILVGDSVGNARLGYGSTVPVTMEEMLHHCRAVRRGAPETFVVGDMPFGSYQVSQSEAVSNAVRFIKEGGCDAVKLEGGRRVWPTIVAIADAGILIMGHVGLTPQSSASLGGLRAQGRTAEAAKAIIEDALAVESAKGFSVVLEAVPAEVASDITARLRIPTLGIGAGSACDGQVLVETDLLGIYPEHKDARFVRRYAEVGKAMLEAFSAYAADVRAGRFPAEEHSYHMAAGEEAALRKALAEIEGLQRGIRAENGFGVPPGA